MLVNERVVGDGAAPEVSILTTTYNRSSLLRRSMARVLAQDFRDFELVIIDDCSTDDTPDVVASFDDPRIRYIRNPVNEGGKTGDRGLIQRFVYELARGKYFVYLCDDDYWLPPDLLSRQVKAFRDHPNVAMVIGAQLSYFLAPGEEAQEIFPDTLQQFIDPVDYYSVDSHVSYLDTGIPPGFTTSQNFLDNFAEAPTSRLLNLGATLYSREHFVRSGAMQSDSGVLWQAGFELVLGPACYGNVVYFPTPSLVVDVRARNVSFQRTQVDHFLDSVASIDSALIRPMDAQDSQVSRRDLTAIRARMVRNLAHSYLRNTSAIRRWGGLGLCSEENIKHPVTLGTITPVFWKFKVVPTPLTLTLVLRATKWYWVVPKGGLRSLGWLCRVCGGRPRRSLHFMMDVGRLALSNPKEFIRKSVRRMWGKG